MGLDLTIVIFLLKCGLHENMPLNIPGINAESKQTRHLSTCQKEFHLFLTILRTEHFRDWAYKTKEKRYGYLEFSLGTSEKVPWNSLALNVFLKIFFT